MPSQSIASLENASKKKYRALRYKLIWLSNIALPNFRYPTPFPIPAQGWSGEIVDQRPIVSMRIGDKRWLLRLRGGARFRRQVSAFREMTNDTAVPGEAAIYQKGNQIMVKMTLWLPRGAPTAGSEGTLKILTRTDSLLVAINSKDEKLWEYHGDHLRRWSAEHARQLKRWADDSKFEQRPVPSFAERRSAAVEKQRQRMDSALHEIATQVAGYARRRKFAAVQFDDSGEHSFCETFPWFRLRQLLAEKLDAIGVRFTVRGPAYQETLEPRTLEDRV